MSAVERANRDIADGNHWLARQRLESHLSSSGYDAGQLARLGEIAYAMHDAFNAGRFWLTSTAEGLQVDEAIAVFMRHNRNDAKTVATSLSRAARLANIDSYPPIVQARLRRLGLDAAVIASSPSSPQSPGRSTWWMKLIGIVIASVIVSCSVSCFIGAYQIVQWLRE